MLLYIDTTDFNSVSYAIKNEKKLFQKTYKTDAHKAFEILGKLDEFLKSGKFKLNAIKKIIMPTINLSKGLIIYLTKKYITATTTTIVIRGVKSIFKVYTKPSCLDT